MATNLRKNLVEQATASTSRRKQQTNPSRLVEAPKKAELYKPATFSFHPDQLAWIKATTDQLKKAGYPKPGLSLVVQEAVERMQEELAGKNPKELMADLLARRAERAEREEEADL